jgi:hypothetical protein
MELTPLLELPSPAALRRANQGIWPAAKGSTALDAVPSGPWVPFAIGGPTFGVHALPVALAPVPRRLTVTVPTTRGAAEVHPPVAREVVQRKPFGAPRTALLGHGLNLHSCSRVLG